MPSESRPITEIEIAPSAAILSVENKNFFLLHKLSSCRHKLKNYFVQCQYHL